MVALFSGLDGDKFDRQYGDTVLFRRIVLYFSRYRWQGLVVVLTFTVMAILLALRPVVIAMAVGELEGDAGDRVLQLLLGALFVSAFIEYVANWLRRRGLSRIVGRVIAQLRKDAFSSAVHLDMSFYDENNTGKVVSRITSDTQEFGDVLMVSSDIISRLLQIFILVYFMYIRSPLLTVLLLATTPFVVIAALAFRHMARKVTRQASRQLAVLNDTIQESVSGISVAKNFRKEARIYREFADVNRRSYRINIQRGLVIAMIFPALTTIGGFVTALIVYVGALFVFDNVISASTWFLFVQAVDRFWFPFTNMASFWSQFQQGLAAVERVFALIDADNSVIQRDNRPVEALRGHIVFEDLNFGYSDEELLFRDFNLEIQPGENVALVGHTGAGKSSIARLITRYYEFQGGRILVDGQDIRSFNLQSWRSRLGIVPQSPFLFSGSIMENLRYAQPDLGDAEIEAVARSIGGGEWLETLPRGLQSEVGERGTRLSMGQRQLVSLLRVLLQNPAIFILDEATASIDPFTELQIQEALDLILSQTSSILIAHRLSTVRSADRILVFREGEIIEEGNHEALLEYSGHYAELYNTYFRHQSLGYIEEARERFEASPAGVRAH
ncbi:MAG: ABC transporter ATP-binding protein [Anaerolineaceae bacterium]|nr:ABC transporter ATP-binding protein [Anaerolineaceae bacterium]